MTILRFLLVLLLAFPFTVDARIRISSMSLTPAVPVTLTLGTHSCTAANGTTVVSPDAVVVTGSGFAFGVTYQTGSTVVSVVSVPANTWNLVQAELVSGFGTTNSAYFCANCNGSGTFHVTVTVSASGAKTLCTAEMKTSNGLGVVLDQHNRAVDAATPFTSPVLTTTVANEFLFSFGDGNATLAGDTWTAGNSFTLLDNITNGTTSITSASGYQIVSSTAAYNSSWTCAVSTSTSQWLATFYGATS